MRVLTALLIVGACTFVIARGWELARFSVVYSELDEDENADLNKALAPWRDVSGLGFRVRQATLTVVDTWDEKAKTEARRQELTDLLTVKPLSSGYWLSLARMRVATGEDRESVAKALEMSFLTGPNEGYLMWQRATFGLLVWERMPQNIRFRAAVDLQVDAVSTEQIASTRSILSEKTAQERLEIRSLLQSRGLSPKHLSALGF